MCEVTFGMPVYNDARYIERALLSALDQTFKDIEYIIVDDKGADGSMDIVRKIISSHPRGNSVRIIEHDHNRGLWATRNTTINNSHGKYLFFLDSDDYITPDCIEKLYNEMIKEPVDFVISSYEHINERTGAIIRTVKYPDMIIKGKDAICDYQYSCGKYRLHIALWNKLYDRKFLISNNIYCTEETLFDDLYFSTLLFAKARSCKTIPDITLYYSDNIYSTTNTIKKVLSDRWLNYIIESCVFQQNDLFSNKEKSYYPGYSQCVLRRNYSFYIKILCNNIAYKTKKEYCKKIKSISKQIILNRNRNLLYKPSNLVYRYIFMNLPYRLQLYIYNAFSAVSAILSKR